MIIALGSEHGGLFSNDDKLAEQLLAAGLASGDNLWRFPLRSGEHTSALQSPMRIAYAVFCWKKKTRRRHRPARQHHQDRTLTSLPHNTTTEHTSGHKRHHQRHDP